VEAVKYSEGLATDAPARCGPEDATVTAEFAKGTTPSANEIGARKRALQPQVMEI
jgi:hypothetical protein